MSKSISFGIGGLIIGLIIGFITANSINRRENLQPPAAQVLPNAAPNQPNILVKDQPNQGGAMLPDVAERLDKAQNEPNNFEAQMNVGDMYAKIQRLDKAAEFYEKASQIKPDDYAAIVKTGNAYFDVQQFENAEKWYEKALAKKPADANVRTDLGITFVERKNPDYDRAVKEFQTALETDPQHEATIYNLAVAFYKKGNLEEARKNLQQLENVNPNSNLIPKLKQLVG